MDYYIMKADSGILKRKVIFLVSLILVALTFIMNSKIMSYASDISPEIILSEDKRWYYVKRSQLLSDGSVFNDGSIDEDEIVIIGRSWEKNVLFEYETYEEDGIEKKGFRIPDKVDGFRVTAIGNPYENNYINPDFYPDKFNPVEAAFNNLDDFDMVYVPEGVDTIYQTCFYASGFKAVTLPESLIYIGQSSFFYDENLEDINIPKGVKYIGGRAFRHTPWMDRKRTESSQHLVIVNRMLIDGIKAEGTVTVPQTVDEITEWAFSGTGSGGDDIPSSLQGIYIPSSVESIGNYAFANCNDLSIIDIQGAGLKSLGQQVLRRTAIKELYLPSSLTYVPTALCYQCTSLEKLTIASGITEIRAYAFQGCTSLKQIGLPTTLISLETQCFNNCSSLEEINLPNSIEYIGDRVFKHSLMLSGITLPENLKELGSESFLVNSSAGANKIIITVPEKMTDISGLGLDAADYIILRVLRDSEVMKYLDEEGVSTYRVYERGMQDEVDSQIVNITNNITDNSVTNNNVTNNNITNNSVTNNINNETVNNETVNNDISVTNNIKKIAGDKQLAGRVFTYKKLKYIINSDEKTVSFVCPVSSNIKKLTIPASVKYKKKSFRVTAIKPKACKGLKKLTYVKIGKYVETVGSRSFENCKKLETVVFGKNIEVIGKMAFYGDKRIKSITFIEIKNLKTVNTAAFYLKSKGISPDLSMKMKSKKKMIDYLTKSGVGLKY